MHQFTIDIPAGTDPDLLVESIKQTLASAGGALTYHNKSGSFVVKGVSGGFTVNNSNISITLSNKPWYVSYSVIESYIRKNITLAGI